VFAFVSSIDFVAVERLGSGDSRIGRTGSHSRRSVAHDRHAEGSRGGGKRRIVRSHGETRRGSFAPELRGGEMNGIQRAQRGRQWLRGTIENHTRDVDD
jgi:hypothetical protein